MCYRPNRGECSQHKPHKCQVDGTQPHGVVVLHRSVVSPVPGILNLSDYVDPPSVAACHRPLGSVQPLLRRPGLQSNSKVQVINRRIVSVTTLTEHERDEPWYFCKFVNLFLSQYSFAFFLKYSFAFFLKYSFAFFWKYSFACFWKYSFAFFWKYSFAITYSNRLHLFESIPLHVFASIRLLILSNRLHFFEHIPLLLLGK